MPLEKDPEACSDLFDKDRLDVNAAENILRWATSEVRPVERPMRDAMKQESNSVVKVS